jgi:hypothetical protein
LQDVSGEPEQGQVDISELKISQRQMQNWPSVNNSRYYAPFFILFLDCVNQLTQMNPSEFEFTSSYLARLAHHCFTCKYYETIFPPFIVEDKKNMQIDD